MPAPATVQPVSIIICAHNEAHNLRENLPVLLSLSGTAHQPLPYEVIVIDDGSDDETNTLLHDFACLYPHLRYASIPKQGKKAALRHAVAMAGNHHFLFTDADCRPAATHWMTTMCHPLNNGYDITVGYGAYEMVPHTTLNRCIQWETLHTWWQYSSYALLGMPYMAVGRNLACTRTVALQAMQHPVWNQLPYGDDDLLMAVAGTGARVAVVATAGSQTISAAKDTWGSWVRQKQRHLSTGKYYRLPARLALGAYAVSHAGMWLSIPAMLIAGTFPALVAVAALPLLLQWQAVRMACRTFATPMLLLQWVLGSMGWVIYNFAFLPYIAWKNKTSWI